jgi:hypothetical protein
MSVGYSHLPEKVSSNALQSYGILFMSGLFTAFYCSIPVARALTRQCPIKLSAQKANLNENPVIYLCIFWAAGVYILSHFPRPSFVAEAIAPFAQERYSNIEVARSLSLLAPPVAFFASPLVLYIAWYRKAARLTDQPFVLFLRKFSSRSDYSILSGVLTSCPGLAALAVLHPKPQVGVGEDGSWDPLAIGFEGLKLRHPLRSMPLYFAADNKEWENAVSTLMRSASCMIIDVSDATRAVERESTLISSLGLWQRTVMLQERKSQSPTGKSPVAFIGIVSNALEYDLRWAQAIPRAILGMTMAMLAFLLAAGLTLVDPVDGPKWMRNVLLVTMGLGNPANLAATLIRHFGDIALLQITMLIGVFSLGRMFGHPSLSFRSASHLRRRLRKILASGATARAS